MRGKRVAIYCRVATKSQYSQSVSLELQRKTAERFAAAHGLRVVKFYSDAGSSGMNMDRPGFQALLTGWEQGSFDAVLVGKRTQLGRGAYFRKKKMKFPIISISDELHICER